MLKGQARLISSISGRSYGWMQVSNSLRAGQPAGLAALGRVVEPVHPQPDALVHEVQQALGDDPDPPLGRSGFSRMCASTVSAPTILPTSMKGE